jgi:Putative polyhydroxyalkanoic acid system protein (PHA_gran_rgn)
MPNLSAQIPHQLGREEAKRRLQSHIDLLRQQGSGIADFRESWTGDTMIFSVNAMGNSITGQLRVDDHFVFVDVAVPWFLSMIAGSVRQNIEQKVRLSLAGPSDPNAGKKHS